MAKRECVIQQVDRDESTGSVKWKSFSKSHLRLVGNLPMIPRIFWSDYICSHSIIEQLIDCSGGGVHTSLLQDPDKKMKMIIYTAPSSHCHQVVEYCYWLIILSSCFAFVASWKDHPPEGWCHLSNWTWNQKQRTQTVLYCTLRPPLPYLLLIFKIFIFTFRSCFFISFPFPPQAILYFHPRSFPLIAELLVLLPGITSFPPFWPQMLGMIPLPDFW